MGLESCAVYGCEERASTAGMCATHGGVPPKPGISEPALEERARRAGEAAMRAEPPPILDMGERTDYAPPYDRPVAADPYVYVAGCLRGDHGAMRKAVAEAMIRAVEQGLRAL